MKRKNTFEENIIIKNNCLDKYTEVHILDGIDFIKKIIIRTDRILIDENQSCGCGNNNYLINNFVCENFPNSIFNNIECTTVI